MATQSYANHKQSVPLYHYVLIPVLALTLIGSIVNLVRSLDDHERLYSASLIVVLTTALLILSFLSRIFALKAQDRAIRAEESLRHFVLAGKLPDPRLSIRQIIALRFATDAEFVNLAKRAADENLAADAIKQAVKVWRPDTYRV
jgi:Family of unknown function (DUF6526)